MIGETVWVAIADAKGGLICETRNGESIVLVARPMGVASEEACMQLAIEMMDFLGRAAEQMAYQSLIVIANPVMMALLRQFRAESVARRLVGEIVSARPTAELPDFDAHAAFGLARRA